MTREKFKRARLKVLGEEVSTEGVGGLSEKAIHKILKLTLEENTACHEVKFLGSIADIKNEEGITEIQTKDLFRLEGKLSKFLPKSPVTVVIPLIREKYIRWIDTETGEITEPRRSPRADSVYTAFYMLFPLVKFIGRDGFRVKLMFLSADEYKRLDGWDRTKKRGASKSDKIPRELLEVIDLYSKEDYYKYFPALEELFLAKDFAKAVRLPSRKAYYALKLFEALGFVEQVGKKGRAIVYKGLSHLGTTE